MCGFAGYINNIENYDQNQNALLLEKFCSLLHHRGPDSKGIWFDQSEKVYLSHTRLSINDLTNNGSQPMKNATNDQVIVFNGEIYNHLKIRTQNLQKYNINWKSNSDTETLLQTINYLGVNESLKIFEGMFSFCLFDKNKKKIFLVRDKFGEKPLYYGVIGNNFVFGSELKIFNFFPNFNKKISKKALSMYLKYSYIPEPLSIYEKIFKLNAGEILELDLNKINYKNPKYFENLKKTKWYNLNVEYENNKNNKSPLINLDEILNESVSESLISDVEVGSFLSGGLDSSLISSIAQKHSKKKIKTFSICFKNDDYNEQVYSKMVSEYIKSDHKEIFVTNDEMFKYYEKIADIYDEPFSDSSQIPTSILSKFASENVKVCLTGDGADELFGGYNRYIFINKISYLSKFLPKYLGNSLSFIISKLSFRTLKLLSEYINKLFFSKNLVQLDNKLQKLGIILKDTSSETQMYLNLIEAIYDKNNSAFIYDDNDDYHYNNIFSKYNFNENLSSTEKIMNIDRDMYLTGDILHKVDRAAMHYSLETRVPFLNSKIVNFSSSLPLELKIKNQRGKYILRELSKKYLPKQISIRNKMGFSVPLNSWIRDYSDLFENNFHLNKEYLIELGFNFGSIISHFKQNKMQKRNWSTYLWNLIIFERWLKKYIL